MFTRTIIDIFHGDTVDLPLLANNGVCAVMMKATQGIIYTDPTYAVRRAQAASLGLLTGSYHFATGDDADVQVARWIETAIPSEKDALELDWEDNGSNSASYEQVCEIVQEVFRQLGRYPLLYGSNFLQEKIPAGDQILSKCPLSLASYTTTPKIPKGWSNYTLWQYTGDDQNAKISPHTFPGASNPLDVYQFDGTIDQLIAAWPFGKP